MRIALVFALGLLALGCGPRDRSMDLKDAVRNYNRSLRWNAFERASTYVDEETRAAWLANKNRSGGGLHITDIQVIRLDKPDPTVKTVDVLVSVSWYRMPETTVRKAVWAQTWQEKEARWRLVDEKQVEAPPPQPAQQWP